MKTGDIRYGIWLSGCVERRKGAYSALMAEFGSAEAVYRADFSKIKTGGVYTRSLIAALCRKDISEAARIADYCVMNHITVLFPTDEGYPALLRDLPDLPAVLYVRGKLPDFSRIPAVGVVGTRKMTAYGMKMAYSVGYGLARGGAAVISGMAAGGDSLAICGALDGGGKVVAVLGCGVDRAYPAGNKRLMEEIIASGAVISEYPPGTDIRKQNFPERNRIISGLSRAVCVTEADTHSGALITAKWAKSQARELFAVPGKVGEKGSAGVNALLKDGATPLTHADDVLKNYAFLYPEAVRLSASEERTEEQAELSAAAYSVDMGDYGKEKEKQKKKEEKTAAMPQIRIKETENDINMNVSEEPPATEAELELIDAKTRDIYLNLPEGEFTPDEAASRGYDCVDVMCALTVLEIQSLVKALPGGRYKAKPRKKQ